MKSPTRTLRNKDKRATTTTNHYDTKQQQHQQQRQNESTNHPLINDDRSKNRDKPDNRIDKQNNT